MRPDILYEIPLSERQIWMFLQVSESTWYRWKREGFPHMASLILKSLASGKPIMTRNSHQWERWRFNPDGAFISPTGYPYSSYDLWIYEFMQLNGMVSKYCDSMGYDRPRNPLMVINGGRS